MKIVVLSIIQEIQVKYGIKVMIRVTHSCRESKWDLKYRCDPNAYAEQRPTAVPHQAEPVHEEMTAASW